jgi:hypothetical protein
VAIKIDEIDGGICRGSEAAAAHLEYFFGYLHDCSCQRFGGSIFPLDLYNSGACPGIRQTTTSVSGPVFFI